MKPTRLHYFYAQNWPAWIWFTVVPLIPVLVAARALGTPADLSTFGPESRSYLFLLGISWLLGYLVGGLVGWFILGPLYHYRAEINGYPFRSGDRVEILVGARRGCVLRVAEVREERGEVRIEPPESAGRKEKTVFHFAQIIKVDGVEPSVPAERPYSTDG